MPPTDDAPAAPPTTVRRRPRDIALIVVVFAMVMTGATIPTPLYGIYVHDLHLSQLLVTVVFAAYAAGVLSALLLLGRLSDHIGRRRVLVAAVVVSAVSQAIFASTEGLGWLLAARVVSGVASGMASAAATAYIGELDTNPTRAGALAIVANIGGLGFGPLVCGVIAQYAPAPTVVPYLAAIALLLPTLLIFVWRTPETVGRGDGWRAGVGLAEVGVPRAIRVPFLAAAVAGAAAFAFTGFSSALTSEVLADGLDDTSPQTIGVVVVVMFGTAAAAQVVADRLPGRTGALLGLPALPVGGALLTVSLVSASLPLLVVSVVVAGTGLGFSFQAALATITGLAPADDRAGVISAFFVASYIGLSVPVIAAGVLLTTTTLLVTAIALTVFLAVMAAVAGVVIRHSWPKPERA